MYSVHLVQWNGTIPIVHVVQSLVLSLFPPAWLFADGTRSVNSFNRAIAWHHDISLIVDRFSLLVYVCEVAVLFV